MPPWARPIRIPESIEVTHADPAFAIANECGTWRLPFRLAKDVPAGAVLKLQVCGGRNNKGNFPGAQTANPNGDGYLSARLDDGATLSLAPDTHPGTYVITVPAGGLRKGQTLTVVLGDCAGGGKGIKACPDRLLNKFFVLYALAQQQAEGKTPQWAGGDVWAAGTAERIVAACTMHVLGGATDHLRVFAPATTRLGAPVTLLIRPEDVLGNLSHQAPGPIELSLGGAPLRATTEQVLDSTCVRAGVALSTEGVHRVTVRDTASGREALSNPTVCSETASPAYWGMIHGHTEMSDGTGTLEQYFHQLRNEVGLDFGATGDHDHLWETSDEYWQTTCAAVKRWHAPREFVTFLGYEWAKWRKNGDGDRNVYYLDDDQPMYRSDDTEHPTPPDLFKALRRNRARAIVIPHHTGHGGNFCDWKDHSPEHERLVEIFQVRGSYECSKEDGNPVPETAATPAPYPDGTVQRALALGWRVGFTSGGDDHNGHWGTEVRFAWGYKQGLMSVEAGALTREAVFEALYQRRVVATTGARMLLSFSLDGKPFGAELSLRDSPALASCRRLAVEFHGTAALARLDIIRNNRVVHSIPGAGETDMRATWDDTAPLDSIWLPAAPFCAHPFAFYYVRVIQTDGEVGWASPVWIDPWRGAVGTPPAPPQP
ncbi:MAG: hypothetical protein A3K19_32115 [Lentisphaerae bacterium RIFOXYB12_FULL_65_16]|nr:MAG: hypothetical protein A3K18_10895 [Lentisphaerae bacterium RIFOXYA12_64_32]OGV88748.1 MAG: hypothetical protein A3K19_32115 [Lentisphaerae bacterium RIFOXYB12_FULL_65_16]